MNEKYNHLFQLFLMTTISFVFCNQQSSAQTRLPSIIGSNMVLQQNTLVPIWGWAAPGTNIKVNFAGQSLTTIADADSSWQIKLSPLPADTIPQMMTITAGSQQKMLQNILIGEVWLCSGQSNMAMGIDIVTDHGTDNAKTVASNPPSTIRAINIDNVLDHPDVTTGGWQQAQPHSALKTSAVAFFFAAKLHVKLHVPVGIITCAWFGSAIELWTPPAAYLSIPALAEDVKKNESVAKGELQAGQLYQGLIVPLAPFAIKGFLWYQGETNCLMEEKNMYYFYKMQALIASWRKLWKAQLPFYYVLIAPHRYSKWTNMPHTKETLPAFWEQQVAAAQIPKTGFVSISDLVTDLNNIHPANKWDVGYRLANLALAKTYKQKGIAYLYPEYDHKKSQGDKLIVYFRNVKILTTSDNRSPNFFTIAGTNDNYLPATAAIQGNEVVLYNPEIKKPVNVRLGWTEEAMPNLINEAGLPAIPFRSNGEQWKHERYNQ